MLHSSPCGSTLGAVNRLNFTYRASSVKFSWRLSADRLVLESDEDEGRVDDVADRGWAERDPAAVPNGAVRGGGQVHPVQRVAVEISLLWCQRGADHQVPVPIELLASAAGAAQRAAQLAVMTAVRSLAVARTPERGRRWPAEW